MKRISVLLLTTAFLSALCGTFVACKDGNDNKEPKDKFIGTPPVEASAEVQAFFDENLPKYSESQSIPEFGFDKIGINEKGCFIINSAEEFKVIATSSVELPTIDFEKYTLIIGQHWMGNPGFTLMKQAVDIKPNEITLSLVFNVLDGGSPDVPAAFYFWGLYPKLPQKLITVNVITKK